MQISEISIRNFRRLENVTTSLEEKDTVFVGPNNSGKTSATAVFRCFWDHKKFRIHDFSVSTTKSFESVLEAPDENDFPTIQLDLWLAVDAEKVEFGRVFSLLPNLSDDLEEVGIRLIYCVSDKAKLLAAYAEAYPDSEDENKKTILEFLGSDGNLNQHYKVSYASLERDETGEVPTKLDSDEGKRLIQEWVRVDFVVCSPQSGP